MPLPCHNLWQGQKTLIGKVEKQIMLMRQKGQCFLVLISLISRKCFQNKLGSKVGLEALE